MLTSRFIVISTDVRVRALDIYFCQRQLSFCDRSAMPSVDTEAREGSQRCWSRAGRLRSSALFQ